MIAEGSPTMASGEHFRIIARALPEERGYVLQSSEDDFMYEAIDADIKIEMNGKLPFAQGSHRISKDGFLRSVPILAFYWNLVVACKRLSVEESFIERVVVTSTEYVLEFERQNALILARVREEGRTGAVLAETTLPVTELQQECKSVAELELIGILRDNPALGGNPHLKRFAAEIDALNSQIQMTARKRDY